MELLVKNKSTYITPADTRLGIISRLSPSLYFLRHELCVVFRASSLAKRGRYGDEGWNKSSLDTVRGLEGAGVKLEIRGVENFSGIDGPCVFIGNHMSTLETFVLPCIIEPIKDVTFIVKQSLVDYPVFRHIMRSRDPITVGRENPREDLKAVLEGGVERLSAGRSIIVFPQTTRMPRFDPSTFNSIGVKLAGRAGVPVVPVALKTDAWGTGRIIKDFGKIDPSKRVRFAFGRPIEVRGKGSEEHAAVISFIEAHLSEWEHEDAKG